MGVGGGRRSWIAKSTRHCKEVRYTSISRAIGATVSAGALHAQGWGFESLIAHHRIFGPQQWGLFFYSLLFSIWLSIA